MSAESPQQDQPNESDVVSGASDSLNLNQTHSIPNSHSETISNPQSIPDPQENSREDEEEEEEEEEEAEEEDDDEETEQETLSISSDMKSDTSTRRKKGKQGKGKSFKGKGKGKGKLTFKKMQAIEEKVQALMKTLKPYPFLAQSHKLLHFNMHDKIFKKLGLWDFIHVDFDKEIRVDLVCQLVATYKRESRCSYVNGYRIQVNRADLARAFKLPWKKEKGSEIDFDGEALNYEAIACIEQFVSDWVLLHEDTWMMPNEVMEWLKLIKDGHPEKVDWAGLLWFMVEKELKQGLQLRDCYYASHLQHLIKSQREDVFLEEEEEEEENEANSVEKLDEVPTEQESKKEEVNEGENVDGKKEEVTEGENVNVDGAIEHPVEEGREMGGPSTDLTLGQDGQKEEGTKDVEMVDFVEKCKEMGEERDEEEEQQPEEQEEEDQQREWLFHGKNDMGEHFMQRCENAGESVSTFENKKEEEEEEEEEVGAEAEEEDMDGDEEDEDKFHVFPNDDSLEGDGFTGNLLQAMETNHMAFASQQMDSGPSFFNNDGKRVMEHDDHISHHGLNESNKRLRMNESWENKPMDIGTCLENIQQMAQRARMLQEEKEQAFEQSNMNQQILLNELQKRDAVIEHLHKTRLEEIQKKDGEIYRLERELYLMGSILDGYRKALKENQRVFAEYREKAQLFEEPTYKDTGEGGLMLTAAEIQRLEKKREEEYKMNCLILERMMKEAEEDYAAQFDVYAEKVNFLDKQLESIEADAREIIKVFGERKIARNDEENMPDAEIATESAQILDNNDEKLPEVEVEAEAESEAEAEAEVATEAPPIVENDEEKVPEVATESAPVQENNEKVCEDGNEIKESVVVPEDEEKVPENS